MGDFDRIDAYIKALLPGEEISDACARVIASHYHDGGASQSYAFVSTGAIANSTELWREMFIDLYRDPFTPEHVRRMADYFGTYLLVNGPRGPVPCWSNLWL